MSGLELLAAVVLSLCAAAALVVCLRGIQGVGDEMLRREDLGSVSEGTRRRYETEER